MTEDITGRCTNCGRGMRWSKWTDKWFHNEVGSRYCHIDSKLMNPGDVALVINERGPDAPKAQDTSQNTKAVDT